MDWNVIYNIADHYAKEYDVLDHKDNLMKEPLNSKFLDEIYVTVNVYK